MLKDFRWKVLAKHIIRPAMKLVENRRISLVQAR